MEISRKECKRRLFHIIPENIHIRNLVLPQEGGGIFVIMWIFFLCITLKLGSVSPWCEGTHAWFAFELLFFFGGFFSVHQGAFTVPFTEMPHWWVQLWNQRLKHLISICSELAVHSTVGLLFSATPADPWLARSTSVPPFPLCLEKVLSTLIQNIAHARFPSANRCHAAVGNHGELVVSSGLKPIRLVAFWLASHACCTLAAFWWSCL